MKPEFDTTQRSSPLRSWVKFHPRTVVAALTGLLLAAGVVSCMTVNRVVLAPPEILGATFVGSDNCAQCHEKITKEFHTADHARLQAKGGNAAKMGCESCHGPGSLHSESGGAYHTIVNPKKSPEACFQCHLEMRGRFNLPHSHPVLAGKISCSDCHNPHKGSAVKSGGTALAAENETCFQCHTAQRGPHVFEHEASREGCITCHEVHGSVNPKMLAQRNSNLCLKCHFQQQGLAGEIVIGGRAHVGSMSRGTCWTAGCHEAVHGSQVNSSLRY